MYTGDSITNAFWTQTATKDEYFATSGSSGTGLATYALCANSTVLSVTATASSQISCTIRRVNNNSIANIATCQAGEKRVGG